MVKRGGPADTTVVSSNAASSRSDDDILTVRSSHFSFGSPSTLSTQQFRDQQRVEVSLGGMQEAPPLEEEDDVEVGLKARPSWELPAKNRPAKNAEELKEDDIQSVEVISSSSSSAPSTASSGGQSLIFRGMFRFQNKPRTKEDPTDMLSTASPPLPQAEAPMLHSLLQPSRINTSQEEAEEVVASTRTPNQHRSRNRLPAFASSQVLFRKRQGSRKVTRGLLGATANETRKYHHRPAPRGRQSERDNASSSTSSSEGKKRYDLTELPASNKPNDVSHIDGIDSATRHHILNECNEETRSAAELCSREDTIVDSLQTELDNNSKQASLDYYNIRQPSGTSTIDEEPPASSFLTLSTQHTEAPSIAAETGSKEEIADSGSAAEQSPEKSSLPNIMPSPTQSTGEPSSDDDDDDIYTSGLSASRNELSVSAGQPSNHSSKVSEQELRQVVRQHSDKDPASFDFSVHGNLSLEQQTLTSLDLAMERGRTMAHQAKTSLTSLPDDSRRQKLGADIPGTIHTTPPPSEPEGDAALPAPKVSHERRRNRCICVWLILLCSLVMVGAIASALCGLGKCHAIGLRNPQTATTDSPSTEIAGAEESITESPIGPTNPPTNAPLSPLTIRDPPLPNDTILPVPPSGPPTSMPTSSSPTKFPVASPTIVPTSFPTAKPTANPTLQPSSSSPTRRPTRGPTTARPTRGPQTFPVFIPPTNVPTPLPTKSPTVSPTKRPSSGPTRSPTKNPTLSPSLRPVPDPTASPVATTTLRLFTRDALLAAIDQYLEGNIDVPIGNWDVSEITDFSLAFSAGRNRNAAFFNEDLTNWDTSKAVSMRRMFLDAGAFNGDVSNFDTSNVKDMQEMFGRAEAFTGDLSRWDVGQVTTMAGMFRRAARFNSDISGWKTGSVNDMTNMFLNCASFDQNLALWDVRSVTSFAGMFRSAVSFNSDLPWNTQSASSMATMFMSASSFNGDLSSFSTNRVTSMDKMFFYASSFEGKGLENWDTSSTVVFDRMFAGAISLRGDGLQNWNVGNAQFMDKMFAGAEAFSQNLCPWRDTMSTLLEGEVNYMFLRTACPRSEDPMPTNIDQSTMCFACTGSLPVEFPLFEIPLSSGSTGIPFSSRTELRAAVDAYVVDKSSTTRYGFPIGNWDVSAIRDFSTLFSTARNPAMATFTADLSNWDTRSAVDTSSMFEGATSFTDQWNGLANWNMANVREMSRMFAYSGFAGDVSRWNVSRVANFNAMFQYAFGFQSDVSNWDFRGAVRFNSDVSRWNVGSAGDLTQMFAGAKSFNVNLCSWPSVYGLIETDTRGMFAGTDCPSTLDPSIEGSWCSQC